MNEHGEKPEYQPRHMRPEHEPQHLRESPVRPPGRQGEQPPASAHSGSQAETHAGTDRRASMTPAVADARDRRRDAALDSAATGSSGTGEKGVARPPGREQRPAGSRQERSDLHPDQLKQPPVKDEHGQTPLIKVESPGVDQARITGKLAEENAGEIIASVPGLEGVHADTVKDGVRNLRASRDLHDTVKDPNPLIR